MTHRQITLERAVLSALEAVPEGYLLGDDTLRGDAARMARPTPTTAELDEAIRSLDRKRRIAGLAGELGHTWQITDTGRLWLAQNP